MKHILTTGLVALSLLTSGLASAHCGKDHGDGQLPKAEAPAMREVTVAELSQLIADEKVVVFDANGAEIRKKFGVVPGATLLASASAYDTALLPADKSQMLVFYCANTRCTAAESAAKRAQDAGYAQVAVLRVGIKGWADAGKPVDDGSKS
jgi:rhodanese-related sulfurtransferase